MSYIPLQRMKPNGKVDLWDTGPTRPLPPVAPKEPDLSKLKDAELALAQVQHEDALEAYKNALRRYGEQKQEHAAWHAENGGPLKVELWGVDARWALETSDPNSKLCKHPGRYVVDLPRGVKPGKAQIAADEMAKAEAEARARQASFDPQFGRQEHQGALL